jgi:hypothetical protein
MRGTAAPLRPLSYWRTLMEERMREDKAQRDHRDSSRVAGGEDHEVRYLAEKFGLDPDDVRSLIERFGSDRALLEEEAARMKSGL